ncbi:hypothetical protein NDU88_011244 [Pleurodeles waltl]|uniref:Uncharacterized protein n=1 Tax=Pleurodeles waltl TaxID=8319 RepID=A0AAV7Q454_PLEWA|nr:hypothetical protein NDU88_011244 [Pleurodeles waltl]
MATPTMSQPPPFLSDKGEPILPWKRCKNLFDSYLIAIGGEKFSPARKQAVLLHNLGIEGRNIYDCLETLPIGGAEGESRDIYDMYVTMLAAHFESKLNVVLERLTFFARSQGKSESVGNVVAALRTPGCTCDFGDITDSLICDQLVRCTNNKRVQEKLLTKNPDLREAIAIVEGMESTNNWIKEMNDHEGDSLCMVQSTQVQEEVLRIGNDNKTPVTSQEKKKEIKHMGSRCYRCDELTPRIKRWVEGLMEYNFSVEHEPGPKTTVADFLSRASVDSSDESDDDCVINWVREMAVTEDEWKSAAEQD